METNTKVKFSKNGQTNENHSETKNPVIDLYTGQLKFAMDLYNSFLPKAQIHKNGNGKSNSEPASNIMNNPWTNWMTDLNRNWLNTLNSLVPAQPERNTMSKKYKDLLETRYEVSGRIMDLVTGNYNKQMKFITESNKELFEEINRQFSLMTQQNQEFWLTLFSTYRLPLKETKINEKTPISSLEQPTEI